VEVGCEDVRQEIVHGGPNGLATFLLKLESIYAERAKVEKLDRLRGVGTHDDRGITNTLEGGELESLQHGCILEHVKGV